MLKASYAIICKLNANYVSIVHVSTLFLFIYLFFVSNAFCFPFFAATGWSAVLSFVVFNQ